MFQSIKSGSQLIRQANRALYRFPKMILPMLVCWSVYAPILLYFKFYIPWESYSFSQQCAIVFTAICALSAIFSWSSLVILDLIRRIETDLPASLIKSIGSGSINLLHALPVVVIWAIIWFVLSLLEAIFSRAKDNKSEEFTAENAAKTLAGYGRFSLSRAFFSALKKGVRMLVFLVLPAIAWERKGFSPAIKRGLGIAKIHRGVFVSGFLITGMAAFIIFLPPGILFYISAKFEVSFPDELWYGVMLYCAFGWSYVMFLEQMFVAELYLWHLIWERDLEEAEADGKEPPKLEDSKRPSVMDGIADMQFTNLAALSNKLNQSGTPQYGGPKRG